MRRFLLLGLLALVCSAVGSATGAEASPSIDYGLQDDAWLAYGEGSVQDRVASLELAGVGIVRFNLRWDQVERVRGTFDWTIPDRVLDALQAAGLPALVTLYGAPRWANGGRAPNWAPLSGSTFGRFARIAAIRYSWVRDWLIWNEPNKAQFLRPTSPSVYVSRLLNPAYTAIHLASRRAKVGGGATAPRAGAGGVSPITFMRGMRSAHARLDAYAHHPYPSSRAETPWSGGCSFCTTLTMASLPRLLSEVQRDFGPKRIWLTEYSYQTYPDRTLGISPALQAQYLGQAGLRTFEAPRVDLLIHFLYRDDSDLAGWQSGLETVSGAAKPALDGFRLPLAQESRRGLRTVLWGQVRARNGRQPFRLQVRHGSRWHGVGGTRLTSSRGFYTAVVRSGAGGSFRVWSPRDRAYSPVVTIR